MIQLIIDGIALPQSSGDKYRCYPAELNQMVTMISGRVVKEIRSHVQMIEWSYDKLEDSVWRALSKKLRSKGPISVAYLPDDSDSLITSNFHVESLTPPSFGFEDDGKAVWHNVAFTLREVKPHA